MDCDLLNWMFSNFTEAFYRTSCPHSYIRISVKTFQFKVIVMHFLMSTNISAVRVVSFFTFQCCSIYSCNEGLDLVFLADFPTRKELWVDFKCLATNLCI